MNTNPINIPSPETCERIISEMGMLDNIVAHSRQVCRVSLFLSDCLGIDGTNRDLITAAALLHDITKTRSFQTGENHAATGAALLRDMGYPEIADIIGQHVRLDSYDIVNGTPSEAQIVNYSDKRVLHDRIVPLNDRMAYILENYGITPERRRNIHILWEKIQLMEKMLFTGLAFSPDDIGSLIAAQG